MAVNLVIAVTDGDWFDMLRQQPNLDEVNFWAPSAANFRALQPGELFLFKLHAPRNAIVGGGIFAYANALPCLLAWEAFREANGARSAQEMRARIARYRRADPADRSDFEIGCRILTQPFFFAEADWHSRSGKLGAEHRVLQDLQHGRYGRSCALGGGERPAEAAKFSRHGRSPGTVRRAAAHPAAPWPGRVPCSRDRHLQSALRDHT